MEKGTTVWQAPRAQRGQGRALRLRELSGEAVGWAIAPAFKAGTRARGSRFVHPAGSTWRARVSPVANPEAVDVSVALGGHAIVRFSSSWWKNPSRRPDLLGFAIRFCAPENVLDPVPGDQDLVFATLRFPWTIGAALLATRADDFLANTYYGASPFDLTGVGVVKLRVRPIAGHGEDEPGEDRLERLDHEVASGKGSFALEYRYHLKPLATWMPLAVIELQERADIDDRLLHFNPFLGGRGIRPRGFVQAIRRAVYPQSQASR